MIDPVRLSLLSHSLEHCAEQMGLAMIRSAYSPNIKERHDCSAALFTTDGRTVAQAEHIPVHLGALPEAVQAVLQQHPAPGDIFILNDPYAGGSHLPDITIVAPISHGDDVFAFSAIRAHYSDVGGMVPGSMPAYAQDIHQEGIVIPPVRLYTRNTLNKDLQNLLMANMRGRESRIGDLSAQIAACLLGCELVLELSHRWSLSGLSEGFDAVIAHTEQMVRAAITDLPDGCYRAESMIEGIDDELNDQIADVPVRLALHIDGNRVILDFAGTAQAANHNFNCPLAVTKAACCFAFRAALKMSAPANEGWLRPFEIQAPIGSMINAQYPSAVAVGNVETSQRIADLVFAALFEAGIRRAEGQGTMNNLIIGSQDWSYYETIGGGQGASARIEGASGVHVGMTNTLNTPIEALELTYPLRVERYELAEKTGGNGFYRGGDGIIRQLRLLEPATVSILSDHRRIAPKGCDGGLPGTPGLNWHNDKILPAKVTFHAEAGDVVGMQTPGGGGYGQPPD